MLQAASVGTVCQDHMGGAMCVCSVFRTKSAGIVCSAHQNPLKPLGHTVDTQALLKYIFKSVFCAVFSNLIVLHLHAVNLSVLM